MTQGFAAMACVRFCDCFAVSSVYRAPLNAKKGLAPHKASPQKPLQYKEKHPCELSHRGALAGADDRI